MKCIKIQCELPNSQFRRIFWNSAVLHAKSISMDLNPRLLFAARVALGLSREDLAELAGIGARTLGGIEREEGGSLESYLKVRGALERQGVVFAPRTETQGPSITLPLHWENPTAIKPRQTGRLRKSKTSE